MDHDNIPDLLVQQQHRPWNMTAVDRALQNSHLDAAATDWKVVARIVSRQVSPAKLQASLERIIEEPGLPLKFLKRTASRIQTLHLPSSRLRVDGILMREEWEVKNHHPTSDGDEEDADDPPDSDPGVEYLQKLFWRCLRNLWRRVLVHRDDIASRAFTMALNPFQECPIKYLKELLDCRDMLSLQSHIRIWEAYQKTKVLAHHFLKDRGSFVATILALRLPPFLLYLARAAEPHLDFLASEPRISRLALPPLHQGMHAKIACQRPVEPYRIHFPRVDGGSGVTGTTSSERGSSNSQSGDNETTPAAAATPAVTNLRHGPHPDQAKLVACFNRPTPIHLMVYLCPEACKVGTAAHPDIVVQTTPLLYFLESLERYRYVCARRGDFSWTQWTRDLLSDVQQVLIHSAPDSLDDDSSSLPHHHAPQKLFAFSLPQKGLVRTTPRWASSSLSSMYAVRNGNATLLEDCMENFLLTLTYQLLQHNPMVLARSTTASAAADQDNDTGHAFSPLTTYEGILRQRHQQADRTLSRLQDREQSLKRKLADLQTQHAFLCMRRQEQRRQRQTKDVTTTTQKSDAPP